MDSINLQSIDFLLSITEKFFSHELSLETIVGFRGRIHKNNNYTIGIEYLKSYDLYRIGTISLDTLSYQSIQDDPSAIVISSEKIIKSIEYHDYGNLHRINGPARITFNSNGISSLEYFYENKLHRIDGPAVIEYYENNKISRELYYQIRDNKSILYREDGPEIVCYSDIDELLLEVIEIIKEIA